MKILHICAGWSAANGAAVIARLLAQEQQAQGHEVHLATWASVRELRTADEVWTHCGWLPVLWWAGVWAKRLVRVPEACYDPVRLKYHGWKKRLVGPIERLFLRRATKVLATCEAERQWILAYEPRAKVELTEVKRFFDLDQPKSEVEVEQRNLHLLYLGRRHPLKGVEFLARAVTELAEVGGRSRTVELRIVSDHFGEELERDWEWCDVLVLPTLSENFGLVIAEALERGKYVITTDGAPAWEPQGNEPWCSRLKYLRGFRDGSDADRIAWLKNAIAGICYNNRHETAE